MSTLYRSLLSSAGALALLLSLPDSSFAQAPRGDATFQVRIEWETDADVDLWVVEPDGKEVFHGRKNGFGRLHNDNLAGGKLGQPAREDYTIMNGPAGAYQLQVRLFRPASDGRPTTVTLYYTVNGREETTSMVLNGPAQGPRHTLLTVRW
jgi:hypothetical protein